MKKFHDEQRNAVIVYRLLRDKNPDCETGWSYGIEAEMMENGVTVCHSCVRDVFCLREEAEELAVLLAENGVEPCHLNDVIIDRLSV